VLLFFRNLASALRYDGPLHANTVTEDVPLRGVATDVVTEHAGRILPHQQIVLLVVVIVAASDDEPVFRIKLADGREVVEEIIKKYSPQRVDHSYLALNRAFGLDGRKAELFA